MLLQCLQREAWPTTNTGLHIYLKTSQSMQPIGTYVSHVTCTKYVTLICFLVIDLVIL